MAMCKRGNALRSPPIKRLSPFAVLKRPAGALSPTTVAHFSAFPCTDEGYLKEASHTPGTLPPGGCPGNPLCGLSARSAALYWARAGAFLSLFIPF